MDFQQVFKTIASLIFLILSLFLIVSGLLNVFKGQRSKRWSQVEGDVKSSDYEVKVSKSYDGDTVSHYARVNYKYVVNGIEYQSNKVFIGDDTPSSAYLSKQRVEKYTPGSKVKVYYDPEHPKDSVLEPGVHLEIFLPLGCGVIFLGFVVAFLLQEIGQ